ncbi:MAG: hypothetical protein AAFV95_26440 [Bacteroidota bacterium]
MKQVILLAFAIGFAIQIQAQQTQTLFNRARVVGAFAAPIVEIGIDDDLRGNAAGGGAALIIDNFFIGGYGIGSSDLDDLFDDNDDLRLSIGHGGFWVGYAAPSHKLIHLYSSAKIGWGAVDIEFDGSNVDAKDGIFVVTPELGLEVNVFRWFRIGTTLGYRFVDGISNENINKDQFQGLIGGLSFRIGGFGNWHRHSSRWNN